MRSQRVALEIADKIGPDIVYVWSTELEDRQFMTGVEIGFLVASGALFTFRLS